MSKFFLSCLTVVLLAVGAVPVLAQDPNEPNDTFATATSVDCNTTVSGVDLTIGDLDVYKITLTEDSLVSLTLDADAGISPLEDSFLGLFSSAGTLLETDDDDGPGLGSSISRPLTAGVYYIVATSYPDFNFQGSESAGTYSLQVACVTGSLADDIYEPNNTPATAAPLPSTFTTEVLSITTGDVDFFRITVTDPQTEVNIVVDPGAGSIPLGDSILGLFDSQGNLLALNDDISLGNLGSALHVALEPGTYLLGVASYPDFTFTGATSTTGNYTLSLTSTPGRPLNYLFSGGGTFAGEGGSRSALRVNTGGQTIALDPFGDGSFDDVTPGTGSFSVFDYATRLHIESVLPYYEAAIDSGSGRFQAIINAFVTINGTLDDVQLFLDTRGVIPKYEVFSFTANRVLVSGSGVAGRGTLRLMTK